MKKSYIYSILGIFGLFMMEGPVILLANRIDPVIMGMPFLLFWILFWWLFCTVVFFVAYRRNWGKPESSKNDGSAN